MSEQFFPVSMACLTVSDTRDVKTDTSGAYIATRIREAGHVLADSAIVKDDRYQIRSVVSQWIASDTIHAIITTGGTGTFARDITPEAVSVLFDKYIDGFGELFRHISYSHIGTSTIQSRVCAGVANNTFIFVLPGSKKSMHDGLGHYRRTI